MDGITKNGKQSGTIGMNSALTGIKIQTSGVSGLGIRYSTHIPNVGWQSYVADGKESNAISEPRRLEAIKIELTGNASSKYDIYYRVHAQDYGWLGWAEKRSGGWNTRICKTFGSNTNCLSNKRKFCARKHGKCIYREEIRY